MKLETHPYNALSDCNKWSVRYIQKIRRALRSRLRGLVIHVYRGGWRADKVEMIERDIQRLSDANVRQNSPRI